MHVMKKLHACISKRLCIKSEPFNKKIGQRLFKKCKAAIDLSELSDFIVLSATDTTDTLGEKPI